MVWESKYTKNRQLIHVAHHKTREAKSVGQGDSDKLKVFQLGTLEKQFRSNMSADYLTEIYGWISQNAKYGMYIGNIKDIVGNYGLIMYDIILAIYQNMLLVVY